MTPSAHAFLDIFARTRHSRAAGGVMALAFALAVATPASAGNWVNGATFDTARGVPVSFLRFLAAEGDGQMTIRCDEIAGLWIDAGVAGNAELPADLPPGGEMEVTLTFVTLSGPPETVTLSGPAVIRLDGAVLVALTGPTVAPLGSLFRQPAERVDIEIAGTTRPVTLEGMAERMDALARRCGDGWPQ